MFVIVEQTKLVVEDLGTILCSPNEDFGRMNKR
jgi:hypothetical protein